MASANNVDRVDIETRLWDRGSHQLDVQMSLHEQLEIARNLQLSTEKQGKKLKMMLDQQHKAAHENLMESTNSNSKSTLEDPEV